MKRVTLRRAACLAALTGLALPGSSAARPLAAGAPTAGAAKTGITVKTASSRFGTILVDGAGRTLYLFTADRGRTSRCYGACAKAWPVTYAKGTPRAAGGARASLLGRTKRRDGRLQVTYRGRPLYYYVDEPAGQVLCQNVNEFGGLWLVVRPDGRAVRGG
jgi:predicted lipoprotein with Yx(FWY)xxD motif